jgi:N-acetylglutamate synthase-like GNAT family acetyltransferase
MEGIKNQIENSEESFEKEVFNFAIKHPQVILQTIQDRFKPVDENSGFHWETEGVSIPEELAEMDEEKRKQLFERVNSDIELQLLCLRRLKEINSGIMMSDITNFEFSEAGGIGAFSDKDTEKMKEIYGKNYEKFPELQKILLESFDKVIEEELSGESFYGQRIFHTVRIKGELVGFFIMEYDEETDQTIFKSFNTDPKYIGKGIGCESLKESLYYEASNKIVRADSVLHSSICSKYIEDLGFVGVGTKKLGEVDLLSLKRNDTKKHLLKYTDFPEKHLFREAVNFEVSEIEDGVKVFWCRTEELEGLIKKNMKPTSLLTRNIKYATEEGETFHVVVIEDLSEEDYKEFTEVHERDEDDWIVV